MPASVQPGSDGSRWFDVTDPEGNKIEFVQPPARAARVPGNPFSNHIIHVGYIVHNRALEDSFYRTVLGFRPYWFGGMKDDTPTWISQQVPDGTDWLEYMVVGPPDGRRIPAGMSAADAGVLDHFSLGVANVETAYTLLWNGDRLKRSPWVLNVSSAWTSPPAAAGQLISKDDKSGMIVAGIKGGETTRRDTPAP